MDLSPIFFLILQAERRYSLGKVLLRRHIIQHFKTYYNMKKIAMFAVAAMVSVAAYADNNDNTTVAAESAVETVAVPEESMTPGTDYVEPSGFFTSMLNSSVAETMHQEHHGKPVFGRKVTDWASAPKFGGYAIGFYKYSDEAGKHGGDGFNARLIRVYVDGSIFKDFKYRVQLEVQGSKPHCKDFYLAWKHWDELEVKVGQFKRPFTFENPYNPWDVGVGDYSQVVKKLAGMGDYNGEASMGGRDLGLQLQGDVLKVGDGKQRHALFHYQIGVFNGQGINSADANGHKDIIGTLQVQPVKDLYIGFFGWTGNAVLDGITVNRNRYGLGAKYEHDGWSARAEYVHSVGYKASDFVKDAVLGQVLKENHSNGRADAWYATVGVPVNDWFKIYAKYDVYRDGASWSNVNTIYSIAPNFQIHKNLMFQLQYNYVHKHIGGAAALSDSHNEIWAMTYFRF